MSDYGPNAWQRMPGETSKWFERFENHRLVGSERTLLGTVNAWRAKKGKNKSNSIPGAWTRQSKDFVWEQRCDAWDAHERDRLRKEYDEEVAQVRKTRRAIIRAAMARTVTALSSFVPDDKRLTEMPVTVLSQLVAMVVTQARTEYGDDQPDELVLHDGDKFEPKEMTDAALHAYADFEPDTETDSEEGTG